MFRRLGVAFGSVVLGIMREGFVATHVAILVVAGGYDVRHLAIQPFEAVARPFPHLFARLVQHVAVEHYVLVLLDEVAREEHRPDVELLHIIGNPCRTEFEDGLIDVVFRVTLCVAEDDEGKRFGVVQLQSVGPMLCLCGSKACQQTENGQYVFPHGLCLSGYLVRVSLNVLPSSNLP